MLLLFSKKGSGGGPVVYTTVTTFCEEAYNILSYVNIYSNINYNIINERTAASWSKETYSLVQTFPVTIFSKEKWNIFSSVTVFAKEEYTLLNDPTIWSKCKYFIINDRVSTLYSKTNYSLLHDLTSHSKETYTITNSVVSTSSIVEKYDISYSSSLTSTFELLNTIQIEHVSEYNIVDYDSIEVEHESIYVFSTSGILGIADRLVGCWNTWLAAYSDKEIHLHLYNTFSTDRSADFERYYTLYSTKNLHVQRAVLFSTRSVTFVAHGIESSERRTDAPALDAKFSNRYSQTWAYQVASSNRTTILLQLYTETSDRSCSVRCIHSSARQIFYKQWYTSQRWVGTYAKEKTVYADQRYSFAEVVLNRFESIRLVGLDVCALSYSFVVNPSYVSYETQISTNEVMLFEDEKVIPETTTLTTLPIDYSNTSNNVIIINKDLDEIVYTNKQSVSYITFKQIGTTQSYIYEGYIVTLKETTFVKTSFDFVYIDIYDTVDEYITYIQDIDHLKVEIAGKEMKVNGATVVDVPMLTKIPIKIYSHVSLLDMGNVNIKLKWAYPYNDAVINEILLMGSY